MTGSSKTSFLKKVVKRNQVIIAALAVMIIIAGYLNITGQTDNSVTNDTKTGTANETLDNAYGEEKDEAVSTDVDSLEISDEDIYPVGDSSSQTVETSADSVTGVGSEELDIPDEDVSASAENGSLEDVTASTEESDVGSAILASTVLGGDYFGNAKLGREQVRAENKETLEAIVNDESLNDEAKSEAVASLVEMTEAAALEDELETLLEAKGYESVCYIDSDEVEVIVNMQEISDQDVAKIEDVVMRNTDVDATGIVITNVMSEE